MRRCNLWLFTAKGMFSVVEHKDDPNTMVVRARIENDIKNIQQMFVDQGYEKPEILQMSHSDYKFRIFVNRKEWINVMTRLMADLNYTNFKNAAAKEDDFERLRSQAYTSIWFIMAECQNALGQDRLHTKFPNFYDDYDD